jgi:hypothetical protein
MAGWQNGRVEMTKTVQGFVAAVALVPVRAAKTLEGLRQPTCRAINA